MVRLPALVSVLSVVVGLGCAPRANPMLSALVQTRGVEDPQELSRLSFTYEDFRLVAVALTQTEQGRPREESWQIGWDGDELRNVDHEVHLDGAAALLETSTVTWKGAKLDTIVTDAGDRKERTTTFGYDQGVLAKISVDTVSPDGTSDLRRSFGYDDNGALVSVREKLTVNDEERPGTEVTISHQDGKPVRLTRTRDDTEEATTVGVIYEEDLLESFTSVFTPADPGGEEQTTTTIFTYDDEGRIASALIPVPDEEGEEHPEEDDIRFTLTYEDEQAIDLDVTPYSLLAFPLFDLGGHAASTLDQRTQGTRLAELLW